MSPTNYTNFALRKDTYQSALASLFSGKPEDTEVDLSKLFHPTFTFREGDEIMDFSKFVEHIRHLRKILPRVTLDVTQFLRDGNQLAERHSSVTKTSDGFLHKAETFQFAEIAEDGRIAWIVEAVEREPRVTETD